MAEIQKNIPELLTIKSVLAEAQIRGDGVVSIKTGETEVVFGQTGCLHQSLLAEIVDGVQAQFFSDLFLRAFCGDQLVRGC